MMKFLIPVIMAIVGTAGGIGAGKFLAAPKADETAKEETSDKKDDYETETPTYIKMPSQFVIPVVEDGDVRSMVVMSISLESTEYARADVLLHAPKLRDAFLRVMFEHASLGWFNGDFTASQPMGILRTALMEKAHAIVGPSVKGILILDIARQDL